MFCCKPLRIKHLRRCGPARFALSCLVARAYILYQRNLLRPDSYNPPILRYYEPLEQGKNWWKPPTVMVREDIVISRHHTLKTVTGCSVSGCCFSDSTRWRIERKHIVAVLIHSITRWRIIPDYIMDRPGHTYDGAPSYSACPLYLSWWGRDPP